MEKSWGLEDALAAEPTSATAGRSIGRSREGAPIRGFRHGDGPLRISLIAGCHADEPVGPAMLDRLLGHLGSLASEHPLHRDFSFWVVPHVNPDGEVRNRDWTRDALDDITGGEEPQGGFHLERYLSSAVRELPGDDVEFGFPRDSRDRGARPENRAVAAFLATGAPFHLHVSFHGMGFASGPWFLLDPFWVDRTAPLRHSLAARVEALGYRLHDVDRRGEKGFWRIAPGFATRPDSRAMRDHFLALDDAVTANRFRPSSMEHVRSLGGDPLTLVSEMPLFLLPAEGPWSVPRRRVELLSLLQGDGEARSTIRPMPIRDQMRLQLAFLEGGLNTVSRS